MGLQTNIKVNPPTRFEKFWAVLRGNPISLIGIVLLAGIILIALFAPVIAPYDFYTSGDAGSGDIYNAPSLAHPFGTDDAGKDVLSGFIQGARVSLIVAAISFFNCRNSFCI